MIYDIVEKYGKDVMTGKIDIYDVPHAVFLFQLTNHKFLSKNPSAQLLFNNLKSLRSGKYNTIKIPGYVADYTLYVIPYIALD